MFIVVLRFSTNRDRAAELMPAHNEWIARGFDDGVFLIVGGLRPSGGGVVVAHNTTRHEIEDRIAADPFVLHDVVKAELLEVSPSKTDPRLALLGL
jgi:uncharacterized protein YciI